jgi:hypothetical protein
MQVRSRWQKDGLLKRGSDGCLPSEGRHRIPHGGRSIEALISAVLTWGEEEGLGIAPDQEVGQSTGL